MTDLEDLASRLRWQRRDRLTPAGLLADAPAPRELSEVMASRENKSAPIGQTVLTFPQIHAKRKAALALLPR